MMLKLIPSQIAALMFCVLAALPASGSGKASDESARPLVIASMDYVKPSDKGAVIEKTAESLRKHFPGRSVEVALVPASEFGNELTAGKLDFLSPALVSPIGCSRTTVSVCSELWCSPVTRIPIMGTGLPFW